MIELKEFSKEERVLLGLDIIEANINKKKKMTKEEKKKFKKKITSLRKERDKAFYKLRER